MVALITAKRIFTIDDAASTLEVSRATAYRNLTYARTWVRSELHDDSSGKNVRNS